MRSSAPSLQRDDDAKDEPLDRIVRAGCLHEDGAQGDTGRGVSRPVLSVTPLASD